jgi:PAT family beta-lactamase induction signal transducer AmpG
MVTGLGLLVMLAGALEDRTGLPVVEVQVKAVASATGQVQFEVPTFDSTETTEAPRVLAFPATVEIELGNRKAGEVKNIVEAVNAWNVRHGFYESQEALRKESSDSKPSWLLSLEQRIRSWFGPTNEVSTGDLQVGSVGVAYFKLSQDLQPGEELVVQLDRSEGDSNIRIVEGQRFEVTSENSSVPMATAIQLDSKLAWPTHATISASTGNSVFAWSIAFCTLAAIFLGFFSYHCWALPRPLADRPTSTKGGSNLASEFAKVFTSFFRKPGIGIGIAFLVVYRFAEAQLLRIAQLFMLDTHGRGGLSLTTSEIGFVYGTIGVVALILGGILGGFAAARHGLRFWLPWMAFAINVPNFVYVYLSIIQPENYFAINLAVAVEQFGYGFGFAAYMLYMLYLARGEHQTAHYAICTGFMALGIMLPGMWSGWLQEIIGYEHFFVWVMLATIPSFLVTAIVYWNLDPNFGRREEIP